MSELNEEMKENFEKIKERIDEQKDTFETKKEGFEGKLKDAKEGWESAHAEDADKHEVAMNEETHQTH